MGDVMGECRNRPESPDFGDGERGDTRWVGASFSSVGAGGRRRCGTPRKSEPFKQAGRASLLLLDGDHACLDMPDIDTQPAEQCYLERCKGDSSTDNGPRFDAHTMTLSWKPYSPPL